jgi:hypothetical protein
VENLFGTRSSTGRPNPPLAAARANNTPPHKKRTRDDDPSPQNPKK